ncbi:MAG: polysaccharide deacetylase family protein [Clostridia bacterium]|nr:polysaccharide deacetylase family protein [Clostridia bacterium]
MKKLIAVVLLLCLLTPSVMAEGTKISFEVEKFTFMSGEKASVKVLASDVADHDRTIKITDNRKNTYEVVIPAGQNAGELDVSFELSASGRSTTYTIAKSDEYTRSKYTCAVTARAATVYSFANGVYQTYVGREMAIKVRIANPERMEAGTKIELRDEDGTVLETIEHNQKRTGYSFSWMTDDSWRPGKWVSLWVDGREVPDARALLAVGVTGSKSIYGVKRDDNKLAFTMDCGAGSDNLPYILDVLDEFGLKITFFVTGQFAKNNPDYIKEMAARGHEIGNHSWSHPSFYELTGEEMLSQLNRTSDLVEELTGQRPNLFRPPEGNCNSKIRAIVNAAGYEVIRWTHESYDARKEASEKNSLKYSTKDVTGGSIILTHIDADCTAAVLKDIFTWYRDNGFEVVKVSELLHTGETATDENGLQYQVQP